MNEFLLFSFIADGSGSWIRYSDGIHIKSTTSLFS